MKALVCRKNPRSQSYQTFFFVKQRFFPFFPIKLCHFKVHTIFFLCYKHSSLTTKIRKTKKAKLVGLSQGLTVIPKIFQRPRLYGNKLLSDLGRHQYASIRISSEKTLKRRSSATNIKTEEEGKKCAA
jgi:hypothetical protein